MLTPAFDYNLKHGCVGNMVTIAKCKWVQLKLILMCVQSMEFTLQLPWLRLEVKYYCTCLTTHRRIKKVLLCQLIVFKSLT